MVLDKVFREKISYPCSLTTYRSIYNEGKQFDSSTTCHMSTSEPISPEFVCYSWEHTSQKSATEWSPHGTVSGKYMSKTSESASLLRGWYAGTCWYTSLRTFVLQVSPAFPSEGSSNLRWIMLRGWLLFTRNVREIEFIIKGEKQKLKLK